MFEKIVLRSSAQGSAVTAGQLAEALLFYQNVHLILDRGSLLTLVKQIGSSTFLSLLQRPGFSATYTEEMLATSTERIGPMEAYTFQVMQFVGAEGAPELVSGADRVQFDLERQNGMRRAEAKAFAKAFDRKVPVRRLSGDHFIKGGVAEAAKSELEDVAFVKAAMRLMLQSTVGGFDPGPDFRFQLEPSDLGHYVFHDLDLEGVNARRRALGFNDAISIAHLLNGILSARGDLALAAHYGGDFSASAASSSIVRLRYEIILKRTDLNLAERRRFSEIVLPDMPMLSEVIDSGERGFLEFLGLLDKAGRFKDWLRGANPDEGLAREYLKAVSSRDWIQTNQAKSIRYIFTLLIDGISTPAGLVAGVVDNFLVEKLLGGWRPNHFIESRLAPFIQSR